MLVSKDHGKSGAVPPFEVRVAELLTSRYADNKRPLSWDLRLSGIDVIRSTEDRELRLLSNGGQSPPQVGWKIVLTGGDATSGYTWTLYGMPKEILSLGAH